MDRKTKIFFGVFFGLIAITIVVTFCKFFILKDYYIQAQADCDPTKEACFVTTCDPSQDDTCPTDPAKQTSYTKLIRKKASEIPLCDPSDKSCDALACGSGADCQVIYCDKDTVGDGETCNDPAEYNKKTPPSDNNADKKDQGEKDNNNQSSSGNADQ
ncbi:MAG: hypothetical protein P4L58_03790 [Candidatus Pacebacteria bacterium]|nr:hypothetical protein [Candidatus Paceibacterota bacterium]